MKGKFLSIIILSIIIFCVFCYWSTDSYQPHKNRNVPNFVFIPHVEIPELKPFDTIYRYAGFSLQYAEEYEQAYWVAYMHCKAKLSQIALRSNAFKKDPNIVTESASSADYRKSGYDRGHLAPAADMKWSVQAMNESFYYSNICPQLPTLNRGVWKDIEEKVRHWVQIYDTVYIITGPILYEGLPTIGKNKVAVPEKFYKVILLYSSAVQDAVGFIVPNITNLDNDIHKYLVPVDSVETVTNILFFTQISESVRKKIKKNSSIAHWN